jgi:hypothetical protein
MFCWTGNHAGIGISIDLLVDRTFVFIMSDGKEKVELSSNNGMLTGSGSRQVTIVTNGYPCLLSLLVNKVSQEGGGTEKWNGIFQPGLHRCEPVNDQEPARL